MLSPPQNFTFVQEKPETNNRQERVELCTPNLLLTSQIITRTPRSARFPTPSRLWLPQGYGAETSLRFCGGNSNSVPPLPGLAGVPNIVHECPVSGAPPWCNPTPPSYSKFLCCRVLPLRLCFKGDHRTPKPSRAKSRLGFCLFSTILRKKRSPSLGCMVTGRVLNVQL